VVAGEGSWAVLEKELLPGVEVGDSDAVFFTDVGEGDLVEEVLSEQGDLLLRSKMATLLSHGCSSARVLLLTLTKASSCFDWGETGAETVLRSSDRRPRRGWSRRNEPSQSIWHKPECVHLLPVAVKGAPGALAGSPRP